MSEPLEKAVDKLTDTIMEKIASFFRAPVTAFFLAPVTAFFLPRVYRDAAKSPWVKGVLYIAYGSFLLTALVLAIFLERAHTSDEFMRWIRKEIPVIIWTPEGLSLENGQKTAALTHPIYGPIAVFDMDRTDMTENDMGQLFFFVTAKKIFFQEITGQIAARDVTQTTFKSQEQPRGPIRFTGEFIENYYQNGKRAFLLVTPFVVFPGSFLILLIVNLIYSAVGLLPNLMRTQRLNYGAIFNLACFSMGTSLTLIGITLIGLVFSFSLPAILTPLSFLISLIYMLAAVTLTEKTG